MHNPLINHPPRLSDLRGEALQVALNERHERNRDAWLQSRARRPWWVRVLEWWAA